MCTVKEYIGVWKEQYFAMIRIQFPEFLRSATLLIYAFVSNLPVNKVNRQPIEISANHGEYEDKIECEVLYDPPPGTRRGDVIIIHGLHGSTYKTWRQGVYEHNEVKKIQLRRNLSVSSTNSIQRKCSKCEIIQKKKSKCSNSVRLVKSEPNLIGSDSMTEINCMTKLSDDDDFLMQRVDCGSKQFKPKTYCDSNLDIDDNINYIKFTCDNLEYKSFENDISHCNDHRNSVSSNDACDAGSSEDDIDDMDVYQDGNPCICDDDDMNNDTFLNELNLSEQRLKYLEVYGNVPLLIGRFLFFFVKFMVNFIKEICSLYKKMLDNSEGMGNLSACWPRDWLPMDCPYTRVISVNYTTFLWMPIWTKSCNRTSLEEKSLEMARQLENLGVGKHPVLWAAHSKGGLFIKQIFIDSWRRRDGLSGNLFSNTNTIVFYSVPQHGSVLAHLFTSPFVKPSVEIVEVRTGSPMVHKLQCEFIDALKASSENRKSKAPPLIVSYTETIPTNMNGVLVQIVFPTTADPGVGYLYGIPLDHRMICKFASRESVLYKDLVQLIEQTCKINYTS